MNRRRKFFTLEGCSRKDKKTPFYLEPVRRIETDFFYCPQVYYSMTTHWLLVRFPWFSVTYICGDVMLTPSFKLAAYFYMPPPNDIMNRWCPRPSIIVTRHIKDDNHQSNIFTPPEAKFPPYKINTFPPAGLAKIYPSNMQIDLKF